MSVFTNALSDAPEQAREYTAAILGLVGDRDPLDVLRTTGDALAAAYTAVDERAVGIAGSAGKMVHASRRASSR